MTRVVVVGDLMTDAVAHALYPLARGSDTASTVSMHGGGSGANIAAWLAVDGIVGPLTWNALVSAYLRAQGGQAASQEVFQAWTQHNQAAARYEATPQAVTALFARTWHAADGWTFDHCEGAAGSFFCTWSRTGEQLVLGGNDNTGAPF